MSEFELDGCAWRPTACWSPKARCRRCG
jgi:hypothetical protein